VTHAGSLIRRATQDDVPEIAAIWTRSSERLARMGLDQWQYPVRTALLRDHVAAGTCWVIEDGSGDAIGTVTVDGHADPKLWQPSDEPDAAYYVHRLVLDDRARHAELGSAVLDWASRRALADGKRWMRLDAWTSNPGLHRYYLDRGFRYVRTIQAPDVPSGVLFERDASVTLDRGPSINERALPN
jgi:GNAT superfamily N-acetyltransferase